MYNDESRFTKTKRDSPYATYDSTSDILVIFLREHVVVHWVKRICDSKLGAGLYRILRYAMTKVYIAWLVHKEEVFERLSTHTIAGVLNNPYSEARTRANKDHEYKRADKGWSAEWT